MKIKQTSSKKNRIIILSTVILVIAAIGAVSVYAYNKLRSADSSQSAQEKTTLERSKSDEEQSNNIEKNPNLKEERPNTDTPTVPAKDSQTGKSKVEMVSSFDLNNGTLSIRGGINGVVSTSGTCYAQLTGPNGKNIRKDTTLLPSASTVDCKTIQISTSGLTSGTWSYRLIYSSDDTEGSTNETSFSI